MAGKTENVILLAIRKTCLHCMSGNKEEVSNCRAGPDLGKSQCLLWEYREGPLSDAPHAKRFILSTIHQHCIKCVGKESEVTNCTTNGDGGYRKCLLFEYRNGNRRL